MRPSASPRCLLCSFKRPKFLIIQGLGLPCSPISTKTTRPTRMILQDSRKVARNATPVRKKIRQNGPFGGMNQTVANIRGLPQSGRSHDSANSKRDNRGPTTTRQGKPRSSRGERGFKALKMQRPLAPLSYEQRIRIKSKTQDIDSFEMFPLLEAVSKSIYSQALQGMVNVKPTPVQRVSIPALIGQKKKRSDGTDLGPDAYLIAAETGSGKTLSYLIPTINALKLAEKEDSEVQEYERLRAEESKRLSESAFFSPPITNSSHPTTGRPKAIILVPSQELVAQVGAVVKSLGHTIKFRSALISSALTGTVIRSRIFSTKGIDIVVSTPHLLASIAEAEPNILSRVTHLVIDEADSLLDRSFAPITSTIIDRATPSLKQIIMCSATIPLTLDSYLRTRFPNLQRLVTPNLHAIPRRVQLAVVNVEQSPYQGNKNLACADTIWSIGRVAADNDSSQPPSEAVGVKRIMVFVNEREKTLEVSDYLVSKGIDAIAMNRDTSDERKSEILSSFTQAKPHEAPTHRIPEPSTNDQPNFIPIGMKAPSAKKTLHNVKVLVTTDLGSRGIDTLAVRNVILYDVPHSTIDFIHRLGRTGRMGRRGKGYVLVGKDDRRDVVAEVREGMFLGKSLI
ncbi:mrh4/ATP-dependent RNA helicase [Blumeria hordei DH14]|uniref:RNA helicase n=1 Tax=Blumeria graminis f. sp. hordei (strain DH14) TaxID=546991 RepID=N1JIT7_BLUG1|nr:mrh4/ATP-dependent RNA helicase [Blumeria hordei DH14]